MRFVYHSLFAIIWIAFFLYWQVMSADVKATRRIEPAASRIARAVVFLLAIFLMTYNRIPIPWLYRQFYAQSFLAFWVGAGITIAGMAFAVWARMHIGRNWSRSVTLKEDHELITSGPYRLVRHPIYTGILTGLAGSAIALAQVRGVIGFAMIAILMWLKLSREERFMREQFGERYNAYAQRVAALVPFVL